MKKLNLKIFEAAAQDIEDTHFLYYSCLSINRAVRDSRNLGTSHNSDELIFYKELFDIKTDSCEYTFVNRLGFPNDYRVVKNVQLLALCFAHEIARWKNNKK